MSITSSTRTDTILALILVVLITLSGCTTVLEAGGQQQGIRFVDVAQETGLQYNVTDPLSFGNGRVGAYVLDGRVESGDNV